MTHQQSKADIIDQQSTVVAHDNNTLTLPTIEIVARSYFEYSTMFGLDQDGTLKKLLDSSGASILDCPGSASSVGAQVRNMAKRAGSDLSVVSADIIYDNSPDKIYEAAVSTVHRLLDPHIEKGNTWGEAGWLSKSTPFDSPKALLEYRLAIYNAYRIDAEKNREQYVATSLPELDSLSGQKFDLILSGNLLFAYADKHFGDTEQDRLDFHVKSIVNFASLLKENGELRIYPIGTASTRVYPLMDELVSKLRENNLILDIHNVEAMLKADWDQMAVIKKRLA